MKSRLYLFVLSLVIISCGQHLDKKGMETFFNQTAFDKVVVENLPYYDSIKNIAVAHLDTIFNFSNSRHIVDFSDGKGNIEKRQEDESSYSFSYDFMQHKFIDYSSRRGLPEVVASRLSKYFDKLG